MRRPWWFGLSAVSRSVGCSGREHRLTWADGELHAPDHPNVDGELALVALGADPSSCLQTLATWRRHAEDLDVLVLASRGPADPLAPADDGRQIWTTFHGLSIPSRPTARPPGRRTPGEPDGELVRLLQLGSAFSDRLVATVVTAWCQRIEDGDVRVDGVRNALRAALYGRLVETVRAWRPEDPVSVDVVLGQPGAEPRASRDDTMLQFELPFSWLRDVWAKGLAVSADRLCLMAEPTGPDSWALTTVDWQLLTSRLATTSLL